MQPSTADPTPDRPCRVAYIMSRFPKISETFVLYEMAAVERLGVDVAVYPLIRERATCVHPEAAAYAARAHFEPFLSGRVAATNLGWLLRRPGAYLAALAGTVRHTWRSRRFFWRAVVLFPKAARFASLMKSEGINHIHAHFASHPAAVAYIVHRLTGIPYSFTAHGSDLHCDRHMLREKLKCCRFAVTISEYNRRLMEEEYGRSLGNRLAVIHCGVDPQWIAEETPADETERQNAARRAKLTILCIGRLIEVKGHPYLLQACQRLREQGMDLSLELVGEGPERAALERLARDLGLARHVHFLGSLRRDEVRDRLRRADVLACPSVPTLDGRREGIPVVLMEAMSCGLPVVASRLSGIPELVEHERTGLLVAPRDVEGIADALHRLSLDGPLRTRLGQAGREKVLRDFNLATSAEQLVAQFRSSPRPRALHEPCTFLQQPSLRQTNLPQTREVQA